MNVKATARETVISSRPHQKGSQVIVGVNRIAAANQKGSGLIIDRDTFEVGASTIKLSPSRGGTGVVIDGAPMNPELYLSEEHSAEFVAFRGYPDEPAPPVYRSRTLFMVTQAMKTVHRLSPVLDILRATDDEFELSSDAQGVQELADHVDRIRDTILGGS